MLMLSTAASLALLSLSLPFPLRKRRVLHILPSRFSSSNAGLQGAKSFARDRNGLRISACASPICAEGFLAGEILKALEGIKEISLRNASRICAFFHFYEIQRGGRYTRPNLFISELTSDFLRASRLSKHGTLYKLIKLRYVGNCTFQAR